MKCGWLYVFILFCEAAATTLPLVTTTSHIPLTHIMLISAVTYLGTTRKPGHSDPLKHDFPLEGSIFNGFQPNSAQPFLIRPHIIPVSIKVRKSKVKDTELFCIFFFFLFITILLLRKKIWSCMKANIPYVIPHNLCCY